MNQQPGFTCPGGQSLGQQTMLGLALQGVPLGGIPLGGIPLGGIPLGGIPLGGIAVGTPLGGIPLGGHQPRGHSTRRNPARGHRHEPECSPLGGITLGSIPASAKLAIFECPIGNFVCADTDTLAQAKAAGAIKQTAKLEDLGYYKDANGQDITLKDLVKGLPPDTTLEDLLATVLLKTAYDWETLPLPGFPLQDFSPDGGTVTYTVSVLLNGSGPLVDGAISVHLPPGARYVTDSTQLSGGPGTIDGEPTLQSPENELTWHVNGLALDTSYELSFRAKPGLSLGTEAATAKISATGLDGTVNAPDPAATLITEPGEPANGQPNSAPTAQPDTLYLGYTSSGSDRDYFQVHADPGEQLTIHLSHLKVDDDLVIYGPGIAPLRTPHPGAEAPTAGDVPFELGQRTQSITPEALSDVPQDAVGQSALDVSDNRGLADEEVSAVSPEGGTYTIQVASFDGGYSNDPWVLRVEKSPAIPLPPTCTNPQGPGTGVTKPMPVVPAAASTLYLFASKRFGDLYGLQAENDVFSQLQTLAARSDAAGGAVIPVDANGAVLTALNARASDSCSPGEGQRRRAGRGQPARQPTGRQAVRQVHRHRRRRRLRHPVRARSRQLRVRERARLREHVLRRHEQPVPEHVRARLPADRRPARRRQLLGQGAVRPRARGRPPRRDAEPDPRPDHPVHPAERCDQPDAGSDDRLRLPRRTARRRSPRTSRPRWGRTTHRS